MSTQDNNNSADGAPDTEISYSDAIDYWTTVPATVDGVLGGFGHTSLPRTDVRGSLQFIRSVRRKVLAFDALAGDAAVVKRGCDVGAGIGRVTRDVLTQVCDKVDLVEPVIPFADQIAVELAHAGAAEKLGDVHRVGMQDFFPAKNSYMLVWCQWCLGQLKDTDLVAFLVRCSEALVEGGLIFVKENNTSTDEDEFDSTDSSVTRSDSSFRSIFHMAGLELLVTEIQHGLPAGLYPVRSYALRPYSYHTS
ncbi:alpha-N-methyltransferase NTM1 [Myxozyma melibiosi]|uniref:Alpha N-terminal protein methyltransferase 1 n=1 Tax=Myxozyma melibiosi TaxID=54550 RepID=A0ABR1F7Q0_9ASCO